jgi:hypothetical protein
VNCYNITFENNDVYGNNGAGITFSRNTTHSVARNNYIHDQIKPIEVSRSFNNEIYNNKIINSELKGIDIDNEIARHNVIEDTNQIIFNNKDKDK